MAPTPTLWVAAFFSSAPSPAFTGATFTAAIFTEAPVRGAQCSLPAQARGHRLRSGSLGENSRDRWDGSTAYLLAR